MQLVVHLPDPYTIPVVLYGITTRNIGGMQYDVYCTNKGNFIEFLPGRFIRSRSLRVVDPDYSFNATVRRGS